MTSCKSLYAYCLVHGLGPVSCKWAAQRPCTVKPSGTLCTSQHEDSVVTTVPRPPPKLGRSATRERGFMSKTLS